MERGWIKLHRALLKNALWKDCNANQKTIMITLLLMAAFDDNSWIYKGEKFETKPGQFITSLKSIAEASGCNESTIRRSLVKFQTFGFCTSKATNKNRLITIVNWGKYQEEFDEPTSNRQATDKQPTTNKNVKNKECNKYINNSSSTLNDSLFLKVITAWNALPDPISKVLSINPKTLRYKNLTQRIKEQGEDCVLQAIDNIQKSSFLRGENDKGWTITFDWFIKPNSFQKVLEGNYSDKMQKNRHSQAYKEKVTEEQKKAIQKKIQNVRKNTISFKPKED